MGTGTYRRKGGTESEVGEFFPTLGVTQNRGIRIERRGRRLICQLVVEHAVVYFGSRAI